MPFIEWSQVPTGVVTGFLVEGSRWVIGQVFRSTQKRKGRSRQQPSRAATVLQELFRIVSTSLIVVIALTYVQSSAWTDYKQLARRLTKRQTVMLAEAYLSQDTQSPQLLDYINTNAALLVEIEDANARDSALFADHQVLVSLGLIEEGHLSKTTKKIRIRGKPTTVTEVGYSNKITLLGVKAICWKLHLPKPPA